MKVSVCITTYNVAPYIATTIDSVLAQQTQYSFEICISDDLSTDNTREILEEYQRKHPDIIRLNLPETHRDVCKNNYDLIMMARGEYIAWLDGDDYWITTDKIEKQVKILDDNLEYSSVRTNWRNHFVDEDRYEDRIVDDHEFDTNDWSKAKSPLDLLFKDYFSNKPFRYVKWDRYSAMLCRRAILVDSLDKNKDLLLNSDHTRCNDLAITAILINAGPQYLLEEITTMYLVRSNSLCRSTDYKINTYKVFADLAIRSSIMRIFHVSPEIRDHQCNTLTKQILRYADKSRDREIVARAMEVAKRDGWVLNRRNRLYASRATAKNIFSRAIYKILLFINKL